MKIYHLFENESKVLYRGLTIDSDKSAPKTIIVRPDDKVHRKPKTSSIFFHNLVNALCFEKFGVYVRNLPFFYKKEEHTYYYGHVYKIEVNDSMDLYYAKDVFDFTAHYRTVRFDYKKFVESVLEANKHIKTDAFFRDYFIKAVIDVGHVINLDKYEMKNEKDVITMYKDFGKRIFNQMITNGYEKEEDKDMVIEMVENGMYHYLKRFYEYVEILTKTKNYDEISDDVEVMIDADEINMELLYK